MRVYMCCVWCGCVWLNLGSGPGLMEPMLKAGSGCRDLQSPQLCVDMGGGDNVGTVLWSKS